MRSFDPSFAHAEDDGADEDEEEEVEESKDDSRFDGANGSYYSAGTENGDDSYLGPDDDEFDDEEEQSFDQSYDSKIPDETGCAADAISRFLIQFLFFYQIG